jgi:methylphosphotriester-DNA--protein-cysteine methyltransferase
MSTQADVKSIDTLAFVKAAFAAFAHETGQAVSECEMQGQRAVDWITVDQAGHWKAECRRMADLVNKAIKDLEHCRTFKKVGDNTPSCVEEKKALEKARQKLARAEQKAEAVRRWTPVVQQQFREACVRLVRFREVIDVDCPRAMAQLERMLKALDAYRQVASPTDGSGDTGAGSGQAVTRQLDEQPATTPPPPAASEGTTP